MAAPYFWSDQYDMKIQSVGLPARAERSASWRRRPTAPGSCSVASADGRLVAADRLQRRPPGAVLSRAARAMPPIEDVVAEVRADEKALGTRRRRMTAPRSREGGAGAASSCCMHGDWGRPSCWPSGSRSAGSRTTCTGPTSARRCRPGGYAFIASLGSNRNPRDIDDPAVAAELGSSCAARSRSTSRCSGSASAVRRSPSCSAGGRDRADARAGWMRSRPTTRSWCRRAPGSSGTTSASPRRPARPSSRPGVRDAGVRHGRHLVVQFHPESTVDIVASWAASDREQLEQLGLGDGTQRGGDPGGACRRLARRRVPAVRRLPGNGE